MVSTLEQVDVLRTLVIAQQTGSTQAHHDLLKELRRLQLAIETPIETCSRLNFQMLQNICLRIATERQLLQQIANRSGSPVGAAELHNLTDTDQLLIVRILRVLTAIGVVDEVDENTYAGNAVTEHAVTPGANGAMKHHFDLDMAHGGRLVEYMRRQPDNTIYQFAGEPPGCQTLFDFTHGHPTIFGLLSSNTSFGQEQKRSFDDYMASKRPAESMKQWFEIYPAAREFANAQSGPDGVLIVDVGGGPGQELVGLKQAHPELPGRYVLEDLPATLDRIASLPDGIEKLPYDFFTPQPIKCAQAYFMRDVMHNWSEANCTKILSNIVEAMDKEYSVLLIDQYVLPATGADLRAAEMDILMWLHTSGIQRTVAMWEVLLEGAGLKIAKIWNAEGAHESVIEARKA